MSKCSKQPKQDLDHPLAIFKIPEMLPGEVFQMITDVAAPGVLPYYAISNFGRIWHIYNNKFMSTSWDGPGYRIAVLRLRNGLAHTFRVHRLLMMTFRYIEGCEDLMVNHMDGCKTRNYIDFPGIPNPDNLEWCNGSYNSTEAFRLGLKHAACGEKHGMAKLTDDLVRQICAHLENKNLTCKQIADIVGVKLHAVENIKYRGAWAHIAKDYNF